MVYTSAGTSTPISRSLRKIFVTCGTESPSSSSSGARAKTFSTVSYMAIFLLLITRTRLAYLAMSSMLWDTSSTVVPVFLWYSFTSLRMSSRPSGSRPAAGSSSTRMRGFMAITPATATRRFWPPESSKGLRSSRAGSRPTKSAASCTRRSISASSKPIFLGPNAISL